VSSKTTQKILLADNQEAFQLLGKKDEYLRLLEREFNIQIIGRGNEIALQGSEQNVKEGKKAMDKIVSLLREGQSIEEEDILFITKKIKEKKTEEVDEVLKEKIKVSSKKKYVTPKNIAQKHYLQAIEENEIVFSIGPAGTGKTYLAMAMAVNYLLTKQVDRIILVRPAVEAGEKLGYLPGDLSEKITPYLRPLYDALYEMVDVDQLGQYLEKGTIELAPLGYMRGRTFNDSFIVLDEAQNSTSEQMKMFLTRLGFDSKVVVTGDITQVDLPYNTTSGLIEVQYMLKGIKGIKFVYFREKDVVRHQLVQEIVKAYENQKVEEKRESR